MERIMLRVPPLGVKVLLEGDVPPEGVEAYRGISYCEAARDAVSGQGVLVGPDSIEVCRWAPAVLGLKTAESGFEESLLPRMPERVAGYYLAPLSAFSKGVEPDVVIIRGRPEEVLKIVRAVGEERMAFEFSGQIGRSALGVVDGGRSVKLSLSRASNRVLARLRRFPRFERFTHRLFRSERASGLLERVIKNSVADMSMCRNSTVIPYLYDKGNISFFCVGGITWGGNSPADITSGFPYGLFRQVAGMIETSQAG